MEDKINYLSTYRLEKAVEDLESARLNYRHHKFSQSINRSYYAIFHAVRAILAFDKFDSKRHSAIISYFNQHYIATGKIGKEYYKKLVSAFNARTKSDYQDFYVVSEEDAKEQLANSEVFVRMIESFIKKNIE